MSERARIAYFNGGSGVPSVIFRTPLLSRLEERGHHVRRYPCIPNRYEHWPLVGWRVSQTLKYAIRRWQIRRIANGSFDSVILETGAVHSDDDVLEHELRRVARRLVYDIDDAVFLLFPEKIKRIAAMCDHVIAGNEAIADWIRPHNPSLSIIPTCVDERVYASKWESEHRPSADSAAGETGMVKIGWVGSAGNVALLKAILPAIENLAEQKPLRFHIITARAAHESIDAGTNDLLRWIDIDRCDVAAELRQLDVGIMPLPEDHEWSTYKCNAKMIQYMASGLPTVASDVGFNRTLVEDGQEGFLVRDLSQWQAAIDRLVEDAGLRETMGRTARVRVGAEFTIAKRVDDYERAVLFRSRQDAE
ncbi:glycosyltransferase [Stieleria sp. ICT_E10.1]|uniref:glycosyltransferase n=1 Tax=Stieleria sedimenti TaxID=2976331 RepID=UPI00218082E3|nr:glycosyltransferase [Stieleria sedimenti]MCS7470848.1 glycosyltransferase [Stieleria sedimenti]